MMIARTAPKRTSKPPKVKRPMILPLDVQDADKCEQAARGVEIDRDLPLQPLLQHVRCVVVNARRAMSTVSICAGEALLIA